MKNKLLFLIVAVALILGSLVLWFGQSPDRVVREVGVDNKTLDLDIVPVNAEKNEKPLIPEATNSRIKINDGKTTFSFELPENWIQETGLTGREQLSLEEKKNLLKNPGYIDASPSEVDKLSVAEIEQFFDYWPVASISANNKIWYTDANAHQVDFYIRYQPIDTVKEAEFSPCDSEYITEIFQPAKCDEKIMIDGKLTDVWTDMTEKGADGKEEINKGATGGRRYFIAINPTTTLMIIKQAKLSTELEGQFDRLMETLKFDDI